MERILIVDDDHGFQRLLATILRGEGFDIDSADSVSSALALAERKHYDLVLTDLRLPDGDGTEILQRWRDRDEHTPFIILTAFGTIQSAVDAMKLGAADYLTKPLESPDQLRVLVHRTLERAQLRSDRDTLQELESANFSCGKFVANDPRMARVLELIRRVAPTSATVLISGESGTGKELIARCIHDHSPRSGRVFVPVNCAALSPTLIESELFGHEKGAFTGAVGQHIGRFERAHGGTLFLDEIGELDANLQAKLLRVLQERTFERVGGTRQITSDARIIAATNRDLRELVQSGRFREDLLYRLNTFPIEIPPLRERSADISLLARLFVKRAAEQMGRPEPRMTPEVLQRLAEHTWPGNVRELENMMERLVIVCDDEITPGDLPVASSAPKRAVKFKDIERTAIENALVENQGNRTKAARQLGISVRTLQYRLKEYGIP